ncbi:MAG: shikimate dehydrogenase [Eubacteriales bacterium]|nr:shikimate dehydrogenase [Eubacteriales bacterium]
MEMEKAAKPTIYFIGVTTNKSSIMDIFPEWAKALGLKDAVIKGIDIAIHDKPKVYRETVQFIKEDPIAMGALVTTHKIDLYSAASDMFEYLDPYAKAFGELSSISKLDGELRGHAKDPISSGLAMEAFIPENHWKETGADVFIMGAGGSAIAMGAYLMQEKFKGNYPGKIVITNRSQPRLTEIETIFRKLDPGGIEFEYYLTPEAFQNDAVLKSIKPGSLIVNATGLGKDRPGSPLTDDCKFPKNSYAWEINYRGDLKFMHQALDQQQEKKLTVEDGWIYFVYGWTQVISEVFHIDITGKLFDKCERIASEFRANK